MPKDQNEDWTNWDNETPPVEGAFLTDRGWEIPLKGTDPADGLTEVIVALRGVASGVAAAANIVVVGFVPTEPAHVQGDPLQVKVVFNENVDVTAGATITITTTGVSGTIVATAAAQLDTNEVIFDAVIPLETGDLSIAAQTLTGTIVDDTDATPSDLTVSAPVAAGAAILSIA